MKIFLHFNFSGNFISDDESEDESLSDIEFDSDDSLESDDDIDEDSDDGDDSDNDTDDSDDSFIQGIPISSFSVYVIRGKTFVL